ncbi:MAG: hypothetical protein OXH38_02705 [Chloroflexi bacterium]|nr:hypothetical protein [Chloroflexota bacterium]
MLLLRLLRNGRRSRGFDALLSLRIPLASLDLGRLWLLLNLIDGLLELFVVGTCDECG